MFAAVYQAVKALAVTHAAPYTGIMDGSLPQNNGLAMYAGPGYEAQPHMDRGGIYSESFALNGKHADLGVLLPALSNIHRALSILPEYPRGDGWQILSIETATPPNFLSRETGGQWLYGSILRVKFYLTGGN